MADSDATVYSDDDVPVQAVGETRELSSLPPELIVHCCRFVTAPDYAAMASASRAIRQALVQVDNKVWMGWAFERFRRLKLLMGDVHARDDIDWKRVYKAQLAAEAVPPDQAARLTSTVEDFTFNVQIALCLTWCSKSQIGCSERRTSSTSPARNP